MNLKVSQYLTDAFEEIQLSYQARFCKSVERCHSSHFFDFWKIWLFPMRRHYQHTALLRTLQGRYCVFYRLAACGDPALNTSADTTFALCVPASCFTNCCRIPNFSMIIIFLMVI